MMQAVYEVHELLPPQHPDLFQCCVLQGAEGSNELRKVFELGLWLGVTTIIQFLYPFDQI